MVLRVCYRVTIPGENGQEEHHGMCIEGDCVKESVTAEQIDALLDKQKLIAAMGLPGVVSPDQMKLISAEELDAEFGDDLIEAVCIEDPDA